MYANEAEVRRIAKNVKQALSTEEVEACGELVDITIDAKLKSIAEWPIDSNGLDLSQPANLPDTVRLIANYMTAGLCEQRAFAHVEGGEERSSSYGAWIYKIGEDRLNALCSLTDPFIDENIEMDAPIRGIAAPQTFFPVRGFRAGSRTRVRPGVDY